jgi:hypothetical protein
MNANSLFYPDSEQHFLTVMNLDSEFIPQEIYPLLPSIYKLASLGDAIHALQLRDGHFIDEKTANLLLQHSADLLLTMSTSLSGPIADMLKLRASSLINTENTEAAIQQANDADAPLILLCGSLSTWRGKSKRNLYGVAASVPIHHQNALILQADALLEANVCYLQTLLDLASLKVANIPSFVSTDIIACGGEANTYPKQFSYFLPEDEGVKKAEHKKTVVYTNLYNARFNKISVPLAEAFLVPSPQRDKISFHSTENLLLWFRGHDIGHSFFLPETSYRRLRSIGLEFSVVLQEAIADVLGYLLVANGPWQQAFQLDLPLSSTIFLAELLRYIRRGPTSFPDSEAGFIELSYLVSHGYISILEHGEKLAWNPAQLYNGMVALAKELVEVILRTDAERAQILLAEHRFQPNHILSSFLNNLNKNSFHIPTAFAYNSPQIMEA